MKEPLAYYAPPAFGELIQQTPLVEAFSHKYDVTIYGPQAYVPAFNKLDICEYKSISPWLDEKVHGSKNLGVPWKFTDIIHLNSAPQSLDQVFCAPNRPCQPLASIVVNGHVPHNQIKPSGEFLPGSHSRNLLYRFGFDCDSIRLHINKYPKAPTTEVALLSGPLWDNTRRMPASVVEGLCQKISYPCHLVGAYTGTPPRITGEYAVGQELTADAVRKALELVGRAEVVVGTDCGFAYAALAMGKRVIIIQSRASMEQLVPANYQANAFPFRKLNLRCDLVCKLDPVSALGKCTHWDCFELRGDGADCTMLEPHDINRLANITNKLCEKK